MEKFSDLHSALVLCTVDDQATINVLRNLTHPPYFLCVCVSVCICEVDPVGGLTNRINLPFYILISIPCVLGQLGSMVRK